MSSPPGLTFSKSSWPIHCLFQHTCVFFSAAFPRLSNLLFYHCDSSSFHAAFRKQSSLPPSSVSILEAGKFTYSMSIMFVFHAFKAILCPQHLVCHLHCKITKHTGQDYTRYLHKSTSLKRGQGLAERKGSSIACGYHGVEDPNNSLSNERNTRCWE